MGRKITSLIIALLVMAVISSGCGTSQKKEEKNMPSEELCEITIENMILEGKNESLEQIEALANEITVPAIGCRVKLIDCPIAEHEALMKKIQAGIDQVDLVETGLTTSLSALVSSGVLMPLENLLEEHGKELKEKEGRLLQATTIDGHIYAVAANLYCGRAEGIGYNADAAAQYGIAFPEQVDLDALIQIGKQLMEAGSGMYLTTQGNGDLSAFDSFYDMETFGGEFNYGVIMDPVHNTQIVNAYETEEYRKYCRILKQWRDAGYIPADSLITGRNGQDMFNSGESFFQFSSVSPGTELNTVHKDLQFKEAYIPITENRLTTRLVQEFAWGITSQCEHPDKAMELLNLIYTNGQLANLLQYGRENVEYTVIEDGVIRPVANTEDASLYNSYFTIYGDTAQMLHYESDSEITMEDIRTYAKESQTGMTFGYVFQADPVFAQIREIQNVVHEYRPVLETGMADDADQLLDEFITALKAAGMEEIIQENQKQLDVWLINQKK